MWDIEFTPLMNGYIIFILAVSGACMGSFLNCTAIRIVNGEPISRGRSHCMSCGHTLGILDLIPVFSWLFLRGKCRFCGAKISVRYLLAELISAAACVAVYLVYGFSLRTLEMLILVLLLLAVTFADLEGYVIPDRFIIIGIIARVVFILVSGDIPGEALKSLIGGLCVTVPLLIIVLIMEKVMKREAMGGGDIKLLFMTGIYFTWKIDLFSLVASCILGIVFGLIGLKGQKFDEEEYGEDNGDEDGEDRSRMIPFGPAIAAGTFIGLMFGEQVISWYAGLF